MAPCNCGKNRVKPLGPSKAQKASGTPKKGNPVQPAKGRTQSFTLQARDGSTTVYGSRLEAEAARVRRGGGSIK